MLTPITYYIKTHDSATICVRTWGSKKNPPIVLLHGHSMNSKDWIPLIWPFINDFYFIVPDLRGFGESESVFYDIGVLDIFCHDLNLVINHFNLEKQKIKLRKQN